MDPLTHWALGTSGALSVSQKDVVKYKYSWILFFASIGALTPDLDSLIQSSDDPLLYIQYHRHFTHSLLMAPIYSLALAVLCSLILSPLKRSIPKVTDFWRWIFLGMSTHGLLDTCTSYGTHLWWPLSDHRSAWNVVSIIDPLFTIPLIIMIFLTVLKRKIVFVRIGVIFALLYLSFGFFQRESVLNVYTHYLNSKQFNPIQRIDAKPSFGNLWLWRAISFDGEKYRVDAIFKLPFQKAIINPGETVWVESLSDALEGFESNSRAMKDLERFRFFSDDYVFLYNIEGGKLSIGDLRYSLIPNSIEPLWVIKLDVNSQDTPTPYLTVRDVTDEKKSIFMRLLKGQILKPE